MAASKHLLQAPPHQAEVRPRGRPRYGPRRGRLSGSGGRIEKRVALGAATKLKILKFILRLRPDAMFLLKSVFMGDDLSIDQIFEHSVIFLGQPLHHADLAGWTELYLMRL